jgi:uncharacterized protein (TIGR03435 family)
MKFSVRSVEYFYTRVEDEPGRAGALHDRLGLKLETRRAIEILIVDHAARVPTEN